VKLQANHSTKHKMVELKARASDLNVLRERLSSLGAKHVGTFHQKDQYFVVPEGRLKLRTVNNNDTAELIFYDRENISGPKSDDAYILRVQEADDLKSILKKILKPFIVIEKDREIYHYEGTQVHLDQVKKLGKFIEFERPTDDNPKNVEKDRQALAELMTKLQIDQSSLEALSYSDLLEK
jgi:adenylate cyclase, class 2